MGLLDKSRVSFRGHITCVVFKDGRLAKRGGYFLNGVGDFNVV